VADGKPVRKPVQRWPADGRFGWFVTICTHGRRPLFGTIAADGVALTSAGRMVAEAIAGLSVVFADLTVDAVVVMPEHIHAVFRIGFPEDRAGVANGPRQSSAPTDLSEIVRRFKTFTAMRYGVGVRDDDWPGYDNHLWQRGFYERAIRDQAAAVEVRRYIAENPTRS
jgi:putative transposase